MSYQKAKASLKRAREIEQSSSSMMLEYKRKLADELAKIDADRRFTAEGKEEAKAEIKQKYAIEFLKKSHTMKQEYVANVKKSIREAEKVIYTPPKKPDAVRLGRFEDTFKSLKTELMFIMSKRAAFEKLRGFTEGLDDPYLANRVREDFAEIASKILSAPGDDNISKGVGAGEIKVSARAELGELYEGLLKPYQSEDFRGANEIIEVAKMIDEDPRIHRSPIVNNAAKEAFGSEYARYINDTESFFAAHPEHMPEPFVDEEGDRIRQTAEDVAWVYRDAVNPTLSLDGKGEDE
ncbi:hypothetical protein [Paenibacillus aceti]|uniref:Uncharacterized protein n=1 Tax=Paenibacillus aceti TaxID=1820010 RepID=A0ABQ1W5U0_9BACL|nr:hypothetical protein [Paenibacillus aceti]GGG15771.1 hypothetical protein GCM10010913_42190 [Paenibacillus aceti]